MDNAPERVQKELEDLPAECIEFLPVTREARDLAQQYIQAEAVGPASLNDALQVAIATVGDASLIVSWNFKHLVNLARIRKFNAVNLINGYQTVEIRSPLEVIYGD